MAAQDEPTTVKQENIWVAVRIRPLSKREAEKKSAVAWTATDEKTLSLTVSSERSPHHSSAFAYNRVFGPQASSDQVYEESAKGLIVSAMEGYNATLFAYGQTGSGKTYTMGHVTRLAAEEIFRYISDNADREFIIRASAIEIYNEETYDMFAEKRLDDKRTIATNLNWEYVRSSTHLLQLLSNVEGKRKVRETNINDNSSRSHQIFRLEIQSRPSDSSSSDLLPDLHDPGPVKTSILDFVDLAGSERTSDAGMEDANDRLRTREGANINKSLFFLGRVIRSLSEAGSHVPYRESKLTRLLQPSLSGNSYTAIICTISPSQEYIENTKATLQFANSAKRVQLQPKVNEVKSLDVRLKEYELEIARLRQQLDRSASKDIEQQYAKVIASLGKMVEEKEALEKQLRNMERFILRGGPNNHRASWSPAVHAITPMRKLAVSASWTAGRAPDLYQNAQKSLQVAKQERLLDVYLSTRIHSGAKSRINQIVDPRSQYAEQALADLKTEIKCMPHTPSTMQDDNAKILYLQEILRKLKEESSRGGADSRRDETIAAIEAEVERMASLQQTDKDAQTALESLRGKVGSFKLSEDECFDELTMGVEADSPRIRSHFSFMSELGSSTKQERLVDPLTLIDDDLPEMDSPVSGVDRDSSFASRRQPHIATPLSASFTPSADVQRFDSTKTVSSRGTTPPLELIKVVKQKMKRMETDFKESVTHDLDRLRSALEHKNAELEKTTCQKQILLEKVLSLESQVEELQHENKRLKDQQKWNAQAVAASRQQDTPQSPRPPSPSFSTPGYGDQDDQWASTPSVESLLPKIAQLWNELHIPLLHRSRWFLAFRGREVYYFETEHRRLCYLQSQYDTEYSTPNAKKKAEAKLGKAYSKLEWERSWLVQQFKFEFTEEERASMFLKWNIHAQAKNRKAQLIQKLWSQQSTCDYKNFEAMKEAAELVIQLNGNIDPTDGMFNLVFGRTDGDSWVRSFLNTSGAVMAPIVQRFKSPVRESAQQRRSGLFRSLTPRRNSVGGYGTSSVASAASSPRSNR